MEVSSFVTLYSGRKYSSVFEGVCCLDESANGGFTVISFLQHSTNFFLLIHANKVPVNTTRIS